MAFQVQVTGVDELADRQMMTDVAIDRKLYGHSEAQVVVRRQEEDGFPDRTAALLAAKALNSPVEITWRDGDMAEATPCFRGYVQHASAQRLPSLSVLTLSCVSYSKRTDLVPRFRAFQATTLHDIAEQIARTEPLFKIVNPGDLNIPVPLSLQHGETDFAYLTRMLGAWGVPMATEDRTGRVLLGARGQEPPIPFPDADWGWSHLTFEGALHALPSLMAGGGSGAAGLARQALGRFLGQMTQKAAGYHFTPDQAQLSLTHAQTASQTGTSRSEMHLDGAVLPYAPGHVVEVEGVSHLINAVSIRGRTNETTASQTFHLQQPTLPITAERTPPAWMLHPVWAYVTSNEDTAHLGRVQVEFEVEPLDPQPSHEQMWLHTLSPYGGGMGPGGARLLPTPHGPRAHAYAAGFYSLPEVGERVLVQFLGSWDSDAVVLGSIRHGAVTPQDNARDTKRWRTPSGNEIALSTQGEGPEAKDTVDLHAQGRPVFQATVDHAGESVSVQCGPSYVHLLNKNGEMRVEVFSGGAMLLHASGHLQIEGESIQIKAKGGGRVSSRTGTKSFVGSKTLHKSAASSKKIAPKPPVKAGCKFDCAMKFLTRAEGGYTVDQGGPTMYGVTQQEYIPYREKNHPNDPAWPDLSGSPEAMKQLTMEHAREIYKDKYWDSHCESLPLPLALCRFDTKVNGGDARHPLAHSLGLPSGACWTQIQDAANRATPNEVSGSVDSYLQSRLDYYISLATGRNAAKHRGSMQGWANRIGLPNPLASKEADQRSKRRYGDGFKQFIEKSDQHCPGCK